MKTEKTILRMKTWADLEFPNQRKLCLRSKFVVNICNIQYFRFHQIVKASTTVGQSLRHLYQIRMYNTFLVVCFFLLGEMN